MSAPLSIQVLRAPDSMAQLALPAWDLLLRQALAANLTATLYLLACEHGLLDAIPAQPQRHLAWAGVQWRRHGQAVRWEVDRIGAALAKCGVPVLLLNGAAYAPAGLPPAHGRLFSDIDILVPRADIGEVGAALMMAGWVGQHHDAYDQRYYRVWLHEIPPMRHEQRAARAGPVRHGAAQRDPPVLRRRIRQGLARPARPAPAAAPLHASCSAPGSATARLLLYSRGNWLRMPPLARHLFHKAFMSPNNGE